VSPALDIIIVASSGERDLLQDCLRSLERGDTRTNGLHTLVVDNASREQINAWIAERFPWADSIRLRSNAGFTGANNAGLRRAAGDYVLLLNPDTVVKPGVFEHMLEVMERDPEIGVAGCRLELLDGSFDHAAKRSFPTVGGAIGHFLGAGRHKRAPGWLAQYRAPELGEHDCGEVDAANGAFMLVRRRALEQVGPLDEGYWTYGEDLDWCYRFRQRGWKVWYEGAVSIVHVKGGGTVQARRRARHRGLRMNVAFHRAMGRFYRKFYAGDRPLLDAAVYLGIGAKLAVSVARSTAARRSLK
jgi:N-acetylglucosaminyl-diphospho-decaprenol L-rhamnosyltransferase